MAAASTKPVIDATITITVFELEDSAEKSSFFPETMTLNVGNVHRVAICAA